MDITYKIVTETDRDQIIALYRQAGWWSNADDADISFVDRIVSGTFIFAVARDGDRIVGMGRAISDGFSDAYIQDVTVLEKYRKQGVGSGIIKLIVRTLRKRGIGWIGLISEPGAEHFYSELGFEVMKGHTPYILKNEEKCGE
ncbi:MAG TPA: GNAT family N-acetyltransferase [Clostridiales bacterium]|nr:GNAT family N-acetyltransferase [Clostridiales bacterium]